MAFSFFIYFLIYLFFYVAHGWVSGNGRKVSCDRGLGSISTAHSENVYGKECDDKVKAVEWRRRGGEKNNSAITNDDKVDHHR